jgi:hypothetical protein
VAGYNVKEDPRLERRTVSVDELRRLIEAALDASQQSLANVRQAKTQSEATARSKRPPSESPDPERTTDR